jgi:hypothetical protein
MKKIDKKERVELTVLEHITTYNIVTYYTYETASIMLLRIQPHLDLIKKNKNIDYYIEGRVLTTQYDDEGILHCNVCKDYLFLSAKEDKAEVEIDSLDIYTYEFSYFKVGI